MSIPRWSTVRTSATDDGIIRLAEAVGWGDRAYLDQHLVVTSAMDGDHGVGSLHDQGKAVDFGADDDTQGAAAQAVKDAYAAWGYHYYAYMREFIHTRADGRSGWYVKNGSIVGFTFYDGSMAGALDPNGTVQQHINHVHQAQTDADVAAMQHDPYYKGEVLAYQNWLAMRNAAAYRLATERQNA